MFLGDKFVCLLTYFFTGYCGVPAVHVPVLYGGVRHLGDHDRHAAPYIAYVVTVVVS